MVMCELECVMHYTTRVFTWWRQCTAVLLLPSVSSISQKRIWRRTSCPHGSSPTGRLPGPLPRPDWLTGPCLGKWDNLLSALICLWRLSSSSETLQPFNSWSPSDRLLKRQGFWPRARWSLSDKICVLHWWVQNADQNAAVHSGLIRIRWRNSYFCIFCAEFPKRHNLKSSILVYRYKCGT